MKKINLFKSTLCYLLAICCLLVPSTSLALGTFDTSEAASALRYGMTPISASEVKDGSFDIMVLSSSRFFKLELSRITAKDGGLKAVVNIKSGSYKYVYLGTAEEASKADESQLIPVTINGEHSHFEIPLKSLNSDVPCAAFSIKRQKWYNRNIVFDASSLPDKALNFKTPNYDLLEKSTEEYIQKHNLSKDVLGEKPKQVETTEDQNTVKKILAVAFIVMIVGGILNHLLKRRRR
ncbi:Uncharacterised protein [[Eubacterium] infirmum]|nr:Uncharacterised protein [[Eubacterium] infirmum]